MPYLFVQAIRFMLNIDFSSGSGILAHARQRVPAMETPNDTPGHKVFNELP